MDKKFGVLHIRHCILHLYHCGFNASEAYRTIAQTYEKAVNLRTCQRWYWRFREGDFSMRDIPRQTPHPQNFSDEELEEVYLANPTMNMRELAEQIGCGKSTISRRLKGLGIFRQEKKGKKRTQKEETGNRKKNKINQQEHEEEIQ